MKYPESVNILLLGSGGREHAFAWKIAQSKRLARLYIAPGNAGTAVCGTNVDINPVNFAAVKQFVLSNNINMVVVGPEEPLVKGIYDFFKEDHQISNIPVIGPSTVGARLEGSKDFAKDFMIRHRIPTAAYRSFTKKNADEAKAFLETLKAPYVLKADGLAAGKGVLIVDSLETAKAELDTMLNGRFGHAGDTVVIEEFLSGIECSVFVATDGKNFSVLPVAKDYTGKILAFAAMLKDKKLSWLPSYGPEMRGGTANCHVIIDDEPIGSPIVTRPNILVAMNKPSLDKFENTVSDGGYVFIDTSLIDRRAEREDVNEICVNATETAHNIGNKSLANMVMLGAVLKKTELFTIDEIEYTMKKSLPENKHKLIEMNIKAVKEGYNLV